MADNAMPVTDAQSEALEDREAHYECAFHILPTVTDEEVPGVFESIKTLITKAGGTITTSESPERFSLAYGISKTVEGTHQRFDHSFFGWVRFELSTSSLASLKEDIEGRADLLRYLIVALTKEDIENPFKVFEVVVPEFDPNAKGSDETIGEAPTQVEESVEVKEEELDESLDKITT